VAVHTDGLVNNKDDYDDVEDDDDGCICKMKFKQSSNAPCVNVVKLA